MLITSTHKDVTLFRMGRSLGPVVPYWVRAFLVDDLLIDTGTIAARREFMDALRGRTVRTIVNTHHHEDHTGNNAALAAAQGPTIYAHDRAIPWIADPGRMPLEPYQLVVWKRPDGSAAQPIGETIRTANHSFSVLFAPGHSCDHICLYEPDRKWLFTGDVFCGRKIKYFRRDEDYGLLLQSLMDLAKLDVDTIFCGLLGVVRDGTKQLGEKVAFMTRLRDDVLELHGRGLSPRASARKLLGREGAMFYITGGHYAKVNAVRSILGGGPVDAWVE
ncbi:MAG TPA: MBL fold metallo-hydrolase [Spirochaetota bacterium]|nr:MBL fold metallo-hydrolase [Spirochaetota bacterium]